MNVSVIFGESFATSKLALLELRSEFFHCRIFPDNFTRLSTVQSDLCGD